MGPLVFILFLIKKDFPPFMYARSSKEKKEGKHGGTDLSWMGCKSRYSFVSFLQMMFGGNPFYFIFPFLFVVQKKKRTRYPRETLGTNVTSRAGTLLAENAKSDTETVQPVSHGNDDKNT